MTPEESRYPLDWERIAKKDLRRAKNLLDDPAMETYRAACRKITGYYFVERYPIFVETSLTLEDVQGSLEEIGGLIQRLGVHLQEGSDTEGTDSSDLPTTGEAQFDADTD